MIKDSLYDIISSLTNIPVIWANQNAPTIKGDKVVINISEIKDLGILAEEFSNGTLSKKTDVFIYLDIYFVSDNGILLLHKLLQELQHYDTTQVFFYNVETSVTDTTMIIDDHYEKEAYAQVRFVTSSQVLGAVDRSLNVVDSIKIENNVNNVINVNK
jgi:hypothetical protein